MTSTIEIIQSGILSLIQDAGRFGQHHIGLTTGGPLDPVAFKWANRLVGNDEYASAIETTVGGIKFRTYCDTQLAVTGAKVDVKVNGKIQPQWQTLNLKKQDMVELGYATQGCRIYLAFASGLKIEPQFCSTSTVLREGIGGLNGQALQVGDILPLHASSVSNNRFALPEHAQPIYETHVTLRLIPGYQEHHFSRHQQRMFFYHEYTVSDLCDRMGYRLTGPNIQCDIEGILSEGICLGAVQIPKDGQPIVLMNDRQTIGGYPKIGSVLSLDIAKLAQLSSGGKVKFEPITIDHAHNLLTLEKYKYAQQTLISLT
ncbi:biotin-dependent carboxyltransferase family protein [Oceaniserpentilla sp. 4NH20-0058]|uniref:5-oxoprolinase subunit C family protein n=1 Tax=Oceaniserpentilla sp. 4NH20-0058 TaxID=3127660 RepID=UPI00310AE88C